MVLEKAATDLDKLIRLKCGRLRNVPAAHPFSMLSLSQDGVFVRLKNQSHFENDPGGPGVLP